MIKNIIKKISVSIFILLQVALYIIIILSDCFDLTYFDTNLIKYSSIILNFIFCILFLLLNFSINNIFLLLGLGFTLVSDYYLVINNTSEAEIYGVIFFILVQVAYFIRSYFINRGIFKFILSLIARISLCLIAILVIKFALDDIYDTLLNIVAICYFINLVMNILGVLYSTLRINYKYLLVVISLILFMMCDLMIGINSIFNSPKCFALIWVFYVPSQVGLSLSCLIKRKK